MQIVVKFNGILIFHDIIFAPAFARPFTPKGKPPPADGSKPVPKAKAAAKGKAKAKAKNAPKRDHPKEEEHTPAPKRRR